MSENWLAKAAVAKALVDGKDAAVDDKETSEKLPALSAFLTALVTPSGEVRELCKVTVFADGGEWRAALHDPNSEHSLFVTLKKPQDAFQALDKALRASSVDWRAWKGRAKPKGKKG